MPIAWTRRAPLSPPIDRTRTEVWESVGVEGRRQAYDVDVTLGKPFDVVGLKGASLDDIRSYADFLRQTAARLYAPERPRRVIARCPCCEADTATATTACTVFGVDYVRCRACGHLFVGRQPSAEALAEVFATSEAHASTYTDTAAVETRLAQVVAPKRTWTLETFRRHVGGAPARVLDVGAGGGHFVAACRRAGLEAEGYEVSQACRRFARDVFGIDLWPTDFLAEDAADPGDRTTLVTFWGLLEYTPEPRRFLAAARRRLVPGHGMLVVEVPRADCVGSAIQQVCADTVARHLDPTSHMNCFSDASLATALVETGFRPVAAWYFGMDAYELLAQLGLRLGQDDALGRLASLIPDLQASFDAGQLADDLVVAAVPA